jgi:hypothetical protein
LILSNPIEKFSVLICDSLGLKSGGVTGININFSPGGLVTLDLSLNMTDREFISLMKEASEDPEIVPPSGVTPAEEAEVIRSLASALRSSYTPSHPLLEKSPA